MKYACTLLENSFEGGMGGERKGKCSMTSGEKLYLQTSQQLLISTVFMDGNTTLIFASSQITSFHLL